MQGKCWGDTTTVFDNSQVCINLININAKGYCSIHKHEHKFNAFHVIKGLLEIRVAKNDYRLTDSTTLRDGQSTTVKPGEYHQFLARTEVQALEIYWTELGEDISRKSCGGSDFSKDVKAILGNFKADK